MREAVTSNVSTPRLIAVRVVLPGVLFLAALAAVFGDSAPASAREQAARPSSQQTALQELGRRLFFEPLASPSGERSCASCHAPEHGFSDPAVHSTDDFGMTRRHSMTILDAAHHPNAHWDGEFQTVEDLVRGRLNTTPETGSYGGRGGGTPFTPSAGASGFTFHRGFEIVDGKLVAKGEAEKEEAKAGDGQEKSDDPLPGAAEVGKALADLFEAAGGGGFVFDGFTPAGGGEVVAKRVQGGGRYAEGFQAAFGDEDVTLDRIATAIGAYCRTVKHTESAYDRFAAGHGEALGASAQRGLALFEGRAGCNQCHVSDGEDALFTDFQFHNSGVAFDGAKQDESGANATLIRHVARGGQSAGAQGFLTTLGVVAPDEGRKGVTNRPADLRQFKTPTLRDVAKRGPYMHDGRFESLEAVVRYYADGCGEDPHKDPKLKSFEASEQDVADLVAFLGSLSGEERPGLARKAWSKRARTTRLQFVDEAGKPMRRLDVRIVPSGDAIPARRAPIDTIACTTDAQGWITFTPPASTHAYVQVAGGVEPVHGALVPDTCRKALVKMPVKGRAKLVVTFGAKRSAPKVLKASHQVPLQFVNGFSVNGEPLQVRITRTTITSQGGVTLSVGVDGEDDATPFTRTSLETVEGRHVATYEGWVRSDRGDEVVLEIPGLPFEKRADGATPPLKVKLVPGVEHRIDLSDF